MLWRFLLQVVKLKLIFLIPFFILLIVATSFSIYNLNNIYLHNNTFVKFGISIILIFSFLIIARYMLLMIFSILQTIKKSAQEESKIIQNKKVSVIVPCYNEEAVIEKSLKSLINQTYPFIEIIVVDDGSEDRTLSIAKSMEYVYEYKSLKVYTKKNEGKAKALNYGIKKAKGELILCVDADSKLETNAVELMVQHFKDPSIAAVAGSVYISNQDNLWTKLQALEYIEGLNMVRNAQAFWKLVNIIPGPIGMFRKSALLEVGGYEDDTFAEDCDLTLRLIAKGYKIDFELDALSYTEAPENLLDLLKQRYRWTRGILQSIRKHRKYIINFFENPSLSIVLFYMLFEAIIWPFMDFWVNLFIVYLALTSGISILIVYWWILFTVLDISGAIYCLLITKERLSLAFYALYYRIFFISTINIAKIFATLEEWFEIKMNWGKLERKGKL